ncbi:MAG: tRNA pseudouridine(38-40) synthase TruA [Cyclobacteriaceae bacterium]|nr:tRNA pseudouridine(38-40) synthase TruA [Cyclobacteriaceae bacterium]
MRYFIDLVYDGTGYHGWQSQKNAVSVQDVLDHALSLLLGSETETVGSGRTDTGVHALQQIVHFDVFQPVHAGKLKDKLNSYLPRDIAIKNIWEVDPGIHARFDAILRCYEYRITRVKDPFLNQKAYYYRKVRDLEKMNQAAEILRTTRDFQSFSRVRTEVNHFICEVSSAIWEKVDEMIIFSICADRFLRGMVRALAGTMLDVGTGKTTISEFCEIIREKDRKSAGRSVPAHGLYLKSVRYPDHVYDKLKEE